MLQVLAVSRQDFGHRHPHEVTRLDDHIGLGAAHRSNRLYSMHRTLRIQEASGNGPLSSASPFPTHAPGQARLSADRLQAV